MGLICNPLPYKLASPLILIVRLIFLQIVSNSTAEVDNEAVTSPQWEGYIHEVSKCDKLEHLCNNEVT